MPHHRQVHRVLSVLSFNLLVIALLGLPSMSDAGSSMEAAYYVSPNPGLIQDCSAGNPCSLLTAVSIAADGDTIYLKFGEYHGSGEQVVLINKSVTLHGGWNGVSGPGSEIAPSKYISILDGDNARRVMVINNNSSPLILGLTIQGGYASQGNGGGIAILNHTGGSVTIDQCRIQENTAEKYGGGLHILKGTAIIKDSTITLNSATIRGGSIFASNESEVVLFKNDISYNIGSVGYFIEASIIAGGNRIYANEGDVFIINVRSGRTIHFENNLITENVGAVLDLESFTTGAFTFLHNTLWNNDSGVIVGIDINGMIANNIFYGQREESLRLDGGGNVIVNNNLSWGNGSNPNPGTSVVYADPELDASFHLQSGSPAIDAGTPVGVWTDIDGNLRPLGLPDIGADEFMVSLHLPLIRKE